MAKLSDFKAQLATGGARANQFEIQIIQPPSNLIGAFSDLAGDAASTWLLCKATSLPTSHIDDTPVVYRGKTVHFAGERTFEPWTCTFINTISEGGEPTLKIRKAFEEWQALMQNYSSISGTVEHVDYSGTAFVYQMDRNDNTAYAYKFVNIYPSDVTSIALSYEDGNTIESFDVTFVYDYYISNGTIDVEGEDDVEL